MSAGQRRCEWVCACEGLRLKLARDMQRTHLPCINIHTGLFVVQRSLRCRTARGAATTRPTCTRAVDVNTCTLCSRATLCTCVSDCGLPLLLDQDPLPHYRGSSNSALGHCRCIFGGKVGVASMREERHFVCFSIYMTETVCIPVLIWYRFTGTILTKFLI